MKEEILKFFKGDTEDSEETLTKYSHDASLLEVRPQIVLFPKDSEDVKNLVKWVNENKDKYKEMQGTVSWISDKAEFTPKTIQTKDERANLVYAVKIRVKNDGALKIGMYGEVLFQ